MEESKETWGGGGGRPPRVVQAKKSTHEEREPIKSRDRGKKGVKEKTPKRRPKRLGGKKKLT